MKMKFARQEFVHVFIFLWITFTVAEWRVDKKNEIYWVIHMYGFSIIVMRETNAWNELNTCLMLKSLKYLSNFWRHSTVGLFYWILLDFEKFWILQ